MMAIAQPTDSISFVGFGSHAAQRAFAVYQLNGYFAEFTHGCRGQMQRREVIARRLVVS